MTNTFCYFSLLCIVVAHTVAHKSISKTKGECPKGLSPPLPSPPVAYVTSHDDDNLAKKYRRRDLCQNTTKFRSF